LSRRDLPVAIPARAGVTCLWPYTARAGVTCLWPYTARAGVTCLWPYTARAGVTCLWLGSHSQLRGSRLLAPRAV